MLVRYANTIITIPEEIYDDAIVLLICSAISFLINLVFGVFTVPLYAHNRLDIWRGMDIGRLVARLSGIIILFSLYGPALRYVGYVDLVIALVLSSVRIVVARHLDPDLKVAL